MFDLLYYPIPLVVCLLLVIADSLALKSGVIASYAIGYGISTFFGPFPDPLLQLIYALTAAGCLASILVAILSQPEPQSFSDELDAIVETMSKKQEAVSEEYLSGFTTDDN